MKKVIWSFSLLVMALFLSCREDDADRFFSGQNDKLIIIKRKIINKIPI